MRPRAARSRSAGPTSRKLRLVLHGSLGDTVALSGLIRELRRGRPRERITLDVRYPELFAVNPHLEQGTEEDGTTVHLPLGGDGTHHLVDAYAAACGLVVVDTTPELFLTEAEIGAAKALNLAPGTIAIDTWSGWPSRRWLFASFMALADALMAAGHSVIEVGATVPDCTGARRSGPLPNVARSFLDRCSLRVTAAILQRCALFVGNDSGLFHLAAAVGTPQVTLFGPVPAAQRAYATTHPVIPYDCQHCAEHCYRAPSCLQTIHPNEVAATIATALVARVAA